MHMRPKESESTFESSFPASITAVSEARDSFTAWLSSDGLDESTVDELTVVYSELASNAAVQPCETGGTVHTAAWREDDDIVLTVENPKCRDQPEVRRWDLDDALRGGGRGLLLVRAFTDSLESLRSARGALLLRCRRRVCRR